jgi:hypothetical protein
VCTGWQDTTSYYGDARSFLFSLYPRINVYRTTGKATNYVYLNTKKTFSELPIGIFLAIVSPQAKYVRLTGAL